MKLYGFPKKKFKQLEESSTNWDDTLFKFNTT